MLMASRTALFGLVLLLGAAAVAWITLTEQPVKRAYINGSLLTMDAENTVQQAVLIDQGRIIAVGSNEDIRLKIDKSTLVTDLNGKTMMPGIIDAHGHFPGSGLATLSVDLSSPPVGNINNIEQLQRALKARASELGDGDWLFGIGYDDTLLTGAQHPTRHDLDQVSTRHPIFIMHVSGHMGVANSAALALADITAATENPSGGVIRRDSDGIPNGLLEENAAKTVQAMAMDFSVIDFYQMIRHATEEYASVGVTTAQSGGADAIMYAGLRWASKLGLLKSRIVVFPMSDSLGKEVLARRDEFASHNSEEFTVGPIKIIADGSIQGYTGYLSKPYHTPFHGNPEFRGYPRVAAEDLAREVTAYHKAGLQMAIHGNGDASMDDIISAFRTAQEQYPATDPRLILIHAQMARADQLDSFKSLGISPSFFSAHTYYWGDRHQRLFMGPLRAASMSPAKWAVDRKLPFSIHLDTPVVPMQPMLLIWSAVNRVSAEGNVIGAEQRISTLHALRAVTIDAAWQIFEADNRGSIEIGKWADLIVLSDNPLLNPAAIKDIQVLETLVAGRSVFDRKGTAGRL